MSPNAAPQSRFFRFGPFELDSRTGELRNRETRIRLGGQPVQILEMLLERHGEPVFREEIRLRLWPNETIVEFDHSINAAVRQLRKALRDSAENPRYIETVGRRGYRFIAPIENVVPSPPPRAEQLDTGNLSGRTLSHFRIGAKLGSGGMGVVYSAEDLNLRRPVALKFLRFPVRDLPEPARQRFEREARAAAGLSHPNICTVFDLENIAGEPVIVMELVQGEPLAARLAHGPMSAAEALPLAAQVVGALAAAHGSGRTHRDLKPANIMLTPSGAKLLDFGLVKIESEMGAGGREAATLDGAILGTPHYMSPEQAQGKETDQRTDIYSFGIVLCEMLTGQHSFGGEHEPPSLGSITPAPLQQIVRRCLARNPDDRWQSASELQASMQLVVAEPVSPLPVPALAPAARGSREPGASGDSSANRRRALTGWITAVVLLVSVLAFLSVRFGSKPTEAPLVRFNIGLPEKTARINVGYGSSVAVSPGGGRVVFSATAADGQSGAGQTRLWVRSLDTPAARELAGTEGGRYPFWSPDGRWIAFGSGGKLKKIDVNGGLAIPLADSAQLRGGTWNRDGVIVFAPDMEGSPLSRVAVSGGAVTILAERAAGGAPSAPWFLPDGRHFLFKRNGVIRVGSLDSHHTQELLADSNAIYSGGQVLFLRESTLMAQPFDPVRLVLKGTAVPVAENVENRTSAAAGLFSASENGVLVYAQSRSVNERLTWFDRNGKKLSALDDPGLTEQWHFSPDQSHLAASVRMSGNTDIWIYDLLRGSRTRFTFDPAPENEAVWSPDGRTIVFGSSRGGQQALFRKASDGSGREELLYTDNQTKWPESWSPDGKFVLYTSTSVKQRYDIWALPVIAKHPGAPLTPAPWVQTDSNEQHAQFSHDGRWVSYESNESGRDEVYVSPFSGSGGKRQVSTAGGVNARWRRDGKEIFYLNPVEILMAVDVRARGNTLEFGLPHPLFRLVRRDFNYDASENGQRFLAVAPPDQPPNPELMVVQNWPAALKK